MRILNLVENCKRIAISGHENPDGDCAGSCCGLALFMRKKMPGAQIDIFLEPLPDNLSRNIPGSETIIHEISEMQEHYDAFILLDCSPERLQKAKLLYQEAPVKINIDHHITNKGSSDAFCYIEGQASSACELVYNIIGEEDLDAAIAKALYVGIVTDTGVFQYSNTAESTMRAAGRLMQYGFDHSAVIREVFFERTFLQAKALGAALLKSEAILGGKCVICCMDRSQIEELGAQRKDLDSISAQMLLTRGADCSVFLHETEPGVWRGSFRSALITDVARTASLFEGGGHVRAAGCTIRSDIGAAIETIKADIARQLKSAHAL